MLSSIHSRRRFILASVKLWRDRLLQEPHSRRNVALDDPDEAAEIVMIANHRLRIVDARISASHV
jgi:hypothetical protein